MSSIAKLKALLELDEEGEKIAEVIAGMLVDDRKRNLFVTRLDDIRNQFRGMDVKLELTDAEDAVMRFVVDSKRPLTTTEVSEIIGQRFPSLKYRTHTSASLNSLVSKGILGKYKDGYSFYFTTPREAVIVRLKKRGEEPGKCSLVEIATETGMPLGTVLNVIEEMMEG
ncbi:MAG: BlaI/MecI/CopY family transcriptional regulator [Euryarchaeota archaeon]|nr:BlaI/MecI/CopY family transcriptional regulator [Euryarchaeota archaeon]MCG2736873.1 BlaI/MecI/CopY family transcriptional regulator [Candidatus Methanoperedenaceae archaeon]